MKNTCIVVIGCHRSGTSAVAGVLHHLGVDMSAGDNDNNLFEDPKFWMLHREMILLAHHVNGTRREIHLFGTNFEPYLQQYKDLVEKRDQKKLWGVKDPRLCFAATCLLEFTRSNVKIIATHRDVKCSAKSFSKAHTNETFNLPYERALGILSQYLKARDAILHDFNGPVLHVDYNQLVETPTEIVLAIANFVGLEITKTAIDFIDPSLKHH